MDISEFDVEQISTEHLDVSPERWARYMEMMADVGYIKGVEVRQYIDDSPSSD